MSKAARDRFNLRNETEWKICFGLWTAFGVAAGFVINASDWRPTWVALAVTAVLLLLIVFVFSWWTVKRREFDEKDSQIAYFWESAIEQEIGSLLHEELRPKVWIRFGDESRSKPALDWWHPGLGGEIIITAILGLLVFLAMCSVTCRSNEAKTTVTIDTRPPNAVDIGNLKVGPQK